MLSREQEAEHRATLRNAVGETVGIALAAICMNELEKAKTALVHAEANDVKAFQGQAQAHLTILKYLTERPLPSNNKV